MARRQFHIEPIDQNKFIKQNELTPVTNPVMFNAGNGPTPDGILSNEIFGITNDERAGIFSYIDLQEYFIQPFYYKIWLKIDRNLRSCVYETENFKIDSNGYLVQDDNGDSGIKFLLKNIDNLKFKNTKRDELLNTLLDGKKKGLFFTNKLIIIPPYYRDVNTNSDGKVGVGEINKLYINLMNTIKALKESNDYGLDMAGGIRGKIQDIILEIYNWFTVGESIIGGEHTGSGIFKKFGIQRRSVMSKTADNSARLVLSAPHINANTTKDLMVDMDHASIPLSAACTIAYPYMIYELRQWFNNEFGGKIYYKYIEKGEPKQIKLDNIQVAFSDDRLDKEMNEFIHGYSNRIKAVTVPNTEEKNITLRIKGYYITAEEYASGKRESDAYIERDLTWVDLFYITAVAATEDKAAMITRYPMDSYFNQLYLKIRIASTIETEPMVINGKFYRWYPKIRQSDIGKNTSNKFIDTCSIANPFCGLMGADYDGDQVTVKMAYTIEANKELMEYMNSNAQFITLSGTNGRKGEKEAIQAIYNMTLALPDTKLDEVNF